LHLKHARYPRRTASLKLVDAGYLERLHAEQKDAALFEVRAEGVDWSITLLLLHSDTE